MFLLPNKQIKNKKSAGTLWMLREYLLSASGRLLQHALSVISFFCREGQVPLNLKHSLLLLCCPTRRRKRLAASSSNVFSQTHTHDGQNIFIFFVCLFCFVSRVVWRKLQDQMSVPGKFGNTVIFFLVDIKLIFFVAETLPEFQNFKKVKG